MRKLVGALHAPLVFDRRTRVLARHLAELIPADAAVLDVGCGDGTISSMIAAARPDVSIRGVDVLLRPETRIPVELFDGTTSTDLSAAGNVVPSNNSTGMRVSGRSSTSTPRIETSGRAVAIMLEIVPSPQPTSSTAASAGMSSAR